MATLTEITARVANMLSRSDLNTEIQEEIVLALKKYARRITWLTEVRGGELDTVIGQKWYDTFDLSTAAGEQDVTAQTAVDFKDVIKVEYLRDDDTRFIPVDYKMFERLSEGVTVSGRPEYYCLYAGQLGLWPVPDGVDTYYLSGIVKPQIPAVGSDESVFFTEAQDLIESAAAARVLAKFTQDVERAAVFAVLENEAYDDLSKESGLKMSTGRLRAHD